MSDLEQQLTSRLETGAITTTDADEIRDFAAFLRESGPPPGSAGHDPARYTAAYRDIYGDEEGLTL